MHDAPAAAEGRRLAHRPLHDDEARHAHRDQPPSAEGPAHAAEPDATQRGAGAAPAGGTRNHLTHLLGTQRAAFASGPPGYADRIDILRALEDAILRRRDDLAAAVSQDFGGRAVEETLALELFPLLNEIRYARRNLKRWMAPRRARLQWQFLPGKGRIVHQPLGVVGILAPWNYPIFLSLAPLTGVLAAGNHALLKPSELAPATAALVTEMLSALYRADYVSVIAGGPDVAAELTRLPLDHLVFTGSTRVGRLVMKAASENLVPVTLELGGKSPAIVHPSYPIERAAERILTGKLYSAGQTCVAPDYVLVPEEGRDRFVEAVRRLIPRMYPALVRNRDYTRIINAQHYRRLTALVDDARRRGAGIVEINPAAEPCDETNRVFPPTLVLNARDDMAIMQEEIFGPLLPVVGYRTIEEAVAFVNARSHPLAFYYFDDNERRSSRIVERVSAGGVTVNDCIFHVGHAGLPFGGIGPSGMGRYHGADGFETFSHKKGVFLQRRWAPLGLLRPPYGAAARRILNTLLRNG
jgi:coniferyl-aldehyde dehydrogenase